MLRGKFSTKKNRVRATATCSSCVDVAAEVRKTARQGINWNVARQRTPATALMPVNAQKADAEYCCAPWRSSLPLASANTFTSALPASPKSVIDIQVIKLLIVSHTP